MMDEKVIYRVIIKISYCEAYFDFDSMSEAGEFAKSAVVHSVSNEDGRTSSMLIKVIRPNESEEE